MSRRLTVMCELVGACALALTGVLAFTAVADACGARRTAGASRPAGLQGRAPLIIGDSAMIFAAPMLGRRGFEADALGCRQFGAGVSMIANRRRSGTLPRVAVLALGANGPIAGAQIRAALRLMGRRRILALVTPPRSPSSQAAMRRAARAFTDRVLLVDWVKHSAGSGWFAGDGLHVTSAGAAAFTRFVRRRVAPYAFPPVRALALPRRAVRERRCASLRRREHWIRVYIIRGEQRVTCARALRLARKPHMQPAPGWRNYDWRGVRNSAWSWVIARRDGRVVIGTVAGRWRAAANSYRETNRG